MEMNKVTVDFYNHPEYKRAVGVCQVLKGSIKEHMEVLV